MSHPATAHRSATVTGGNAAIPEVSTHIEDYPRIAAMLATVHPKRYPLCVEKAHLILESFKETEGQPQILRRAKALRNFLDRRTIFIEDGELIVGNPASKPMGLEAGSLGPTWPPEELAELRAAQFDISDDDAERLRQLDAYWKGQGRTLAEQLAVWYDDQRLWPFIQSGILFPPWKTKNEGRGHGSAEGAWGLGLGLTLIVVDIERALSVGLEAISAEARTALAGLRPDDPEFTARTAFLESIVIVNDAMVGIANRFADLAAAKASAETDTVRRAELLQIAQMCRHVPGKPARNFREALQSFWFLWLMIASGTASGGRFDQIFHPYYRRDRDAGTLTDREAVELLAALRIKVMQVNFLSGGKAQRAKWAGFAKWNNWVIGGVSSDGRDASNELSYLLLDAARICPTPHYTLTLRVHAGTPESLMVRALEVVKLGLGMPAFVGDKSYIDYLTREGATLADARNYALGGCLDAMIPGKSRTSAIGMFIVPRVLEIALNGGIDPRSGVRLGPETATLGSVTTFAQLLDSFKIQLRHFMELANEEHDILLNVQRDLFPDVSHSMLMADAIPLGRDVLHRQLPFENGSVLNPVGMINVADALAALKKLLFDEASVSPATMQAALAANWDGYEPLRRMCLDAPKYGNGDSYVDAIAAELYEFWARTASSFVSSWGGRVKSSGISITAYGPGGAITGATPDGRHAGETLADGVVSAAQGKDVAGPTALLRSAISVDQTAFQSMLFNLKFHSSALKSHTDLRKVAMLIRTYFAAGGKHVQFNVVDRATLLDAQRNPDHHRNLVVRVAGYSAYFVELTREIQDDVIQRTELDAA